MTHVYWCIRWVLISLVLITLIHYLYNFFSNTLTVPKVKDLIDKPNRRYDELYSEIHKDSDTSVPHDKCSSINTDLDSNAILGVNHTETNTKPEKKTMQLELKNFLNDLKQNSNKQELSTLSDENSNNVYSAY